MTLCPCGTAKSLEECCGPYLNGEAAPTALALMRSRYSAFVLGRGAYLAETLSVAQRQDFDVDEFNASAGETTWHGLEVRKTVDGSEDDQTGTVEFVAHYRFQGNRTQHHELAKFTREEGRWVFADCIMNPKEPPRVSSKVGRNDLCPCGSGKKFKKCCAA